jgi:cytoskeleton protein RodZ
MLQGSCMVLRDSKHQGWTMVNEESSSNSDSSNSVGLLGDYLKQKRLDKNFSLEKLSQKTKISVNILKGLEANDFDHLPSAAYIKGFVTSYVKVLGIPLEEAISKMEYTYLTILGKPFPALNHTKSMPAHTPPKVQDAEEVSAHDVIENSDSIIQNTKSILPLIIFGLVILVFVGGYKLISSVVENEVNSQKVNDYGPKIESSSALVKQAEPKADPQAAEQTPSSKEVTSDTNPTPVPEVKKPVEFQRNFPALEFKKVKSKLFSVKTDAPENDDLSLIPEKIKTANNPGLQNIYIKAADGNTWVSYKIDNNPIESVIISKGADLYLQGNEIRLFLGNVGVTRIFYNNYLIETPTKTGVKSLIFPEESNTKFMLPLFPKAKDDILYTAEDYIKRMNLEEEEIKKRQQ